VTYLQLFIALLTFGRELLKLLESREGQKLPRQDKIERVSEMKVAVKTARTTGDTSEIEKLFSDLWRDGPPRGGVSDK